MCWREGEGKECVAVSDIDIDAIIKDIVMSERYRSNSHFSQRVYKDEPILTTARQMGSYLPDEYREMRAISRWQEGENGSRGRWLSEAELFYRQGMAMADFEDDCPYHGSFKSYFPTYSVMSDRQLRGYFTWRARVRAGNIEETSTSFAYLYLYELLCGIGVADPLSGYRAIESFWQTYRTFAPELDRYVRTWLLDYTIYHNLPSELLQDNKIVAFDRALTALKRAQDAAAAAEHNGARAGGKRRKTAVGTSLTPQTEEALFLAINELSTYRIAESRFAKDHYEDVRHVTCCVYLQLAEHYAKHRKLGLIESLFGEQLALPYTMFGSAVFFDPKRHPDCTYELDEIHRYRCEQGLWTCERFYGSRARSSQLGLIMRAVDRVMRETWNYPHPLKAEGAPKYVLKMVEKAVEERFAWAQTHKPVEVHIDLSSLRGIRDAAARSREALLTDEERGIESPARGEGLRQGEGASGATEETARPAPIGPAVACATASTDGAEPETDGSTDTLPHEAGLHGKGAAPEPTVGIGMEATRAADAEPAEVASACETTSAPQEVKAPSPDPQEAQQPTPPQASQQSGPLSAAQLAYLQALLSSDAPAMDVALKLASTSEDMMVDAVNDALFDTVGDTVIEYAADGPALIEDYREDVEGILQHA